MVPTQSHTNQQITICQYLAIFWVQFIDMGKYNIVPALLSVYGNALTVTIMYTEHSWGGGTLIKAYY